ncbi:MAG TPA: threonine aldolase family protein [Gammaproteobacteria bacterium]|nr:threonine aldolase family protein [Gammaproteobacteria bacterium]
MFKGIDLSSDTVTQPTIPMRQAMFNASVGDEQKNEDPTTNRLQEMISQMLGFDHAIYLPSATMANQIAIASLCGSGDVLLAADNSHIFVSESGGPAVHARVMSRSIPTKTGLFTKNHIEKYHYWRKNFHHPSVKLISIENTTNFGGGIPWEKKELLHVVNYAKEKGIYTHMDGSRIFNASIKTKLSVKEICMGFDMITICLSKGLGCPVGALLVFNEDRYTKVRQLKHLMGGAMRQSGIIAAAGIYALENNVARLKIDHENALALANILIQYNQHIKVITDPPQTNIIVFEWISNFFSAEKFIDCCMEKGLRFSQIGKNRFRAVTHLDITSDNIVSAGKIIHEIFLMQT